MANALSSHEEAFFAGYAYNNRHGSWTHTEYKGAAASLVGFGVLKKSGSMPSTDEVQNIIDPSRLDMYASTNSTDFEDPWYVKAWKLFIDDLRTMPNLGTAPNPFLLSEAMYSELGEELEALKRTAGSS